MTHPSVVLIAALALDSAVVAALGSRIYSPALDPDWRPPLGPAATISIRTGQTSVFTPLVMPSFQVRTWALTAKLAMQAQQAIYARLNGIADQVVTTGDGPARIIFGYSEQFPQDVTDATTSWPTVINFYRLGMVL